MNRRETPRLGGRSAPWLLTRDDYAGRGSELRKEERVSETGGEAVKAVSYTHLTLPTKA